MTLVYGMEQLKAKIIKLSHDRIVLNEADRGLCDELSAVQKSPVHKRPNTTNATSLAVSEFSTPPRNTSPASVQQFEADENKTAMARIINAIPVPRNNVQVKTNCIDDRIIQRLEALERISEYERKLLDRDERLDSYQQQLRECQQRLSTIEERIRTQNEPQDNQREPELANIATGREIDDVNQPRDID